MFCVFDLKLSDLETLAMLRKIKIDSWRNPYLLFIFSRYGRHLQKTVICTKDLSMRFVSMRSLAISEKTWQKKAAIKWKEAQYLY